jgi:hypothetical protein
MVMVVMTMMIVMVVSVCVKLHTLVSLSSPIQGDSTVKIRADEV